jgi:hypothetical protein
MSEKLSQEKTNEISTEKKQEINKAQAKFEQLVLLQNKGMIGRLGYPSL